ncbi:MAG: DUF5131 family protein [Planctomycetaceae bacterium]|nr:DUF5131 family protein [Planctomycetaceae bacterium]
MENSLIGWTDHTWNPWWGCKQISPACNNCYIGPIMRRSGNEPFDGPIRTSEATWKKPLVWNRKAAKPQKRSRIFTCSMSDFFHHGADPWRDDSWDLIRRCQSLDWLKAKRREMDLNWVRDQCDTAGVPLFHKQYYAGTTLCYDGLIDGVQRQDWPV